MAMDSLRPSIFYQIYQNIRASSVHLRRPNVATAQQRTPNFFVQLVRLPNVFGFQLVFAFFELLSDVFLFLFVWFLKFKGNHLLESFCQRRFIAKQPYSSSDSGSKCAGLSEYGFLHAGQRPLLSVFKRCQQNRHILAIAINIADWFSTTCSINKTKANLITASTWKKT